MSELRRQYRIAYHTRVRLRLDGRDDSVVARVTNLSRSGLYVTGTSLPGPGSEVQCRLVLAGERCTLRGRIAWVRPPEAETAHAAAGAGIEFVDLSKQESELLSRIIDPKDEERLPVDVWFEGMPAPIRSQAVIASDGLRLATKLPFLRLNSQVKVSFTVRGIEEERIGTLDSVTLHPSDEDGIPHLQLGVSTPVPGTSPRPDMEVEAASEGSFAEGARDHAHGGPDATVGPTGTAPAPLSAQGSSPPMSMSTSAATMTMPPVVPRSAAEVPVPWSRTPASAYDNPAAVTREYGLPGAERSPPEPQLASTDSASLARAEVDPLAAPVVIRAPETPTLPERPAFRQTPWSSSAELAEAANLAPTPPPMVTETSALPQLAVTDSALAAPGPASPPTRASGSLGAVAPAPVKSMAQHDATMRFDPPPPMGPPTPPAPFAAVADVRSRPRRAPRRGGGWKGTLIVFALAGAGAALLARRSSYLPASVWPERGGPTASNQNVAEPATGAHEGAASTAATDPAAASTAPATAAGSTTAAGRTDVSAASAGPGTGSGSASTDPESRSAAASPSARPEAAGAPGSRELSGAGPLAAVASPNQDRAGHEAEPARHVGLKERSSAAAEADGASRPALAFVVRGGTAKLVVPTLGSFKGAQRVALTTSPGLVVNLPRARAKVPPGDYTPAEGPFERVTIHRRGDGTQIRLRFDPATHTADVRYERDAVQLLLRKR